MKAGSVSYSPIADRYEAVRGGDDRAVELASAIVPWLPESGLLCDVGAGTAVVTCRLATERRRVVGCDISIDMLRQGRDRLSGLATLADAAALPFPDASFDAVTFVWVLHHVGDLTSALTEAARVLRPEGVVVAVSGLSVPAPDDMSPLVESLNDELRPDRKAQALAVTPTAVELGFDLVHEGLARTHAMMSPRHLATSIDERLFSHLWDLDDAAWGRHVAPVIDGLLALPDPDRERHRVFDHPMVVLAPG